MTGTLLTLSNLRRIAKKSQKHELEHNKCKQKRFQSRTNPQQHPSTVYKMFQDMPGEGAVTKDPNLCWRFMAAIPSR